MIMTTEIPGHLLEERVYTRKKPSRKLLEDIEYGYTVSDHLKDFHAGRTVVVKRKTIMAAEAAEGALQTVMRGCLLCRKDAVVVIGNDSCGGKMELTDEILETIRNYKGKGLAVLEGSCFVENLEGFVAIANKLGLIFLAFNGDKFYNQKLFDK